MKFTQPTRYSKTSVKHAAVRWASHWLKPEAVLRWILFQAPWKIGLYYAYVDCSWWFLMVFNDLSWMMMGNFLLLDGSWWCIMLDDGYWWCIMFEDSSGLLLSCLIIALWFSIKRWDTWFTLFLTTPNFTPQKNKTSVSIPSNMVGWLVGCFQPMNYCILKDDQSKDVEDVPFGGCLRMIFKHQNSELCKGLRLCVLVSNHTVSVWLLQSHPRYGSLLALLFSECTLQQKNLWAFRPPAEKRNIYIYI